MTTSKLRAWTGTALILLGLVNAMFSGRSPLSTLVTLGLVLGGMVVTGYDISVKTWNLEGCQGALRRTWIGVFIFFGGLLAAQYFVQSDYLFLGTVFGVASITVGPIMMAAYLRCLRHGS